MKNISIAKTDLQIPFITPPENGGQIVEVSYSCTEDYVLERKFDRSDRSETIRAYKFRGEVSPQNQAPKLGKFVGVAKILSE